MTRWLLVGFFFFGLCAGGRAGVIYEVPETPNQVAGAFDVNILADDVHFETAAILRKVRMRLAIAGSQACKLWIFDAMNSLPIHVVPFTNVPAGNAFTVSTYDFDMQLQVPKDIYVGFSAQGDGWTNTLSDYWSRGFVVNRGVAGTAGQYYYGPVAGEKLTAVFNSGDNSFGCLQILSEPARIDGVEIVTGQVQLAISALPIFASNAVERIESVGDTNWVGVDQLAPGLESTVWNTTNAAATRAFYRIKSR
jgi:hypothetical protein